MGCLGGLQLGEERREGAELATSPSHQPSKDGRRMITTADSEQPLREPHDHFPFPGAPDPHSVPRRAVTCAFPAFLVTPAALSVTADVRRLPQKASPAPPAQTSILFATAHTQQPPSQGPSAAVWLGPNRFPGNQDHIWEERVLYTADGQDPMTHGSRRSSCGATCEPRLEPQRNR